MFQKILASWKSGWLGAVACLLGLSEKVWHWTSLWEPLQDALVYGGGTVFLLYVLAWFKENRWDTLRLRIIAWLLKPGETVQVQRTPRSLRWIGYASLFALLALGAYFLSA